MRLDPTARLGAPRHGIDDNYEPNNVVMTDRLTVLLIVLICEGFPSSNNCKTELKTSTTS